MITARDVVRLWYSTDPAATIPTPAGPITAADLRALATHVDEHGHPYPYEWQTIANEINRQHQEATNEH